MEHKNRVYAAWWAVLTLSAIAIIGTLSGGSLMMMGLVAALGIIGWYCSKPLPPTIFGAIVALAALGSPPPASADPIPPPGYAAVVKFPTCTGFAIGDGLVVTAGHCVKAIKSVVKFADGEERGATLVIYSTSEGFDDLAVFRLYGTKHHYSAALDCRPAPPVRTAIYMVGFPGGYVSGPTTVFGRVAGTPQPWKTRGDPFQGIAGAPWEKPIVPINITAAPGFSGSAVFSEETGAVVGVLVGAFTVNRDLSAMVPISRLCELLGGAV